MAGLSRSARVSIMLGLSLTMFFVELIVGIAAGSIALVADSFHMLNDVLGMVIALWAIVVAKSEKAVPGNTYGWQRAEILGALTNGVLLLGLCLTIYIDAIQRFISIEEVKNPKLVMIVGCVGLTFNILGLALFHDHGHAHGHSHAHGHAHGHAHSDEETVAGEHDGLMADSRHGRRAAAYDAIDAPSARDAEAAAGAQVQSSAMDNQSIIGVPHPVYTQQAIIKSAQQMLDGEVPGAGSRSSSGCSSPTGGTAAAARGRKHRRRSSAGSGHGGHGGGHLNMRGVWVHVFGDCVTNIAVIISGLIIWKAEGAWRFYADPFMSLAINTLVVCITIPLVKSASAILLNGVPGGVDLDYLRRDLQAIPHVLNVHDLHVWQLSDTKNIASLHVLIDRPPAHECVHNTNAPSSPTGSAGGRQVRLMSRNSHSRSTMAPSGTVDMDCLYMDVAAEVKRVMHAHGIHSTTIQPEFAVGQNVS
ncbi:Zinc resistance conferring protein, partial [Coemansia biformis]